MFNITIVTVIKQNYLIQAWGKLTTIFNNNSGRSHSRITTDPNPG